MDGENNQEELRLTIAELQTALMRFFGEVSYARYVEMCGGHGEVSEEFWREYEKLNWILVDKVHPPHLENMIRMYPRAMEAIKDKNGNIK